MSPTSATAAGSPALSVVIATYNRGAALRDLLEDLGRQRAPDGTSVHNSLLGPTEGVVGFEVIVVDDGSTIPAAEALDAGPGAYAFRSSLIRQANAGPGAARDKGIAAAAGDVILIVDDDMRIGEDFLWQHMQRHRSGCDVVLGYIASPANVGGLPVYERFHADQLERFAEGAAQGRIKIRGVHLCTGNVSFRRQAYLDVGGFDKSLGHSEDRELGIRLEKHGCTLCFAHAARSEHESDRHSRQGWLDRSLNYGVFDSRICARHPLLENADPWRFWFRINPLTRPIALAVVMVPRLGHPLATVSLRLAEALDDVGLSRPAMIATTFSYGMQYFRGLRQEAGGLRRAVGGLRRYWGKRKNERSSRL